MKTIEDFRFKKSISFGLYNGKLNEEMTARLLVSRALYCCVDSDFNILRYKSDKIETSKVDFKNEDYQLNASFSTEGTDYDNFEKHYITNITAERMFRNFFFSKDDDYIDKCDYFIFQPFLLSLKKDSDYHYMIYPVVKIINLETVIVEFNFYPSGNSETIRDFVDKMIRMDDLISTIKLPHAYFSALGIEMNIDEAEVFSFEDNESTIFKFEDENLKNICDIAVLYLDLLFQHEGYSWFGRTVISLDRADLSRKEVEYIKNGFNSNFENKLYKNELINFSDSKESKLYIFGHLTLSMGNILEEYIPAVVLDQEISIVNTKLIVHSKIEDEQKPLELLEKKRELQKLRGQIATKYNSILSFHSAMNYAMDKIFNVNDAIQRIDDLIEISFRRKEYEKYERESIFQTVIGIVSVLLSLSAIFEFVVTPIYFLRFNKNMDAQDTLLNYSILLIGGVLVILVYFLIVKKKKVNN